MNFNHDPSPPIPFIKMISKIETFLSSKHIYIILKRLIYRCDNINFLSLPLYFRSSMKYLHTILNKNLILIEFQYFYLSGLLDLFIFIFSKYLPAIFWGPGSPIWNKMAIISPKYIFEFHNYLVYTIVEMWELLKKVFQLFHIFSKFGFII